MKPLKITFLLPGPGRAPTGGGKVVYEYANHLSRKGHRVSLVYPALNAREVAPSRVIKSAASFIVRSIDRNFGPEGWFPMESAVQLYWVPALSNRFVPDGDIVVATAWTTAEWAMRYSPAKGKKFYLIQSWETWDGPEKRVRATWTSSLQKIVIARWLQEMAHGMGVECSYIPNGMDFQKFGLDTPLEERNPRRLMMLYHSHPVKGSFDGLAALSLVRKEVPDLRVTLFGTPVAPGGLPNWVDYHRLPSQKELRACYNQASIFVAPARTEGWPLPPAEAMLCGAALVATDIGGHREYAVHQETALLSPAQAPGKMAENVLWLLRDPELHRKIARQGYECIRTYSWASAVNQLEGIFKKSLAASSHVVNEDQCQLA